MFNRFAELLLGWFTATDGKLLSQCHDSEKKKFIFTGALVLIITLMTWMSSFYALADSLMPDGERYTAVWFFYGLFCLFLSLCWAAIVFNLFRFFVSCVATTDKIGFSGIRDFAALATQLFFCLVIAVVLGFPIAIMVLDSQIRYEGRELQRSQLSEISMTVGYMDKHRRHPDLESEYRRLESLKLEEKGLQVQMNLYKNDADRAVEGLTELRTNQRQQEERLAKIREIRGQMDEEFKGARESDRTLHIIKKSRFIWQNNFPITIFMILFIFIVYASLIFSKFLLAKGSYDHLVSYRERYKMYRYGIVEVHSPVKIRGNLVRFHQFHLPEAIQAAELKGFSEKRQQLHDYFAVRLAEKVAAADRVFGRMRSRSSGVQD
jgi:hypothetical protein